MRKKELFWEGKESLYKTGFKGIAADKISMCREVVL